MENIINTPSGACYPGNYVPLHNAEEVQQELQKHPGNQMSTSVNITETPDVYIMEFLIPGVNPEDFLIETDQDDLSISVLHQQLLSAAGTKFPLKRFDHGFLYRRIHLPENASAEFIRAEYKAGILSLIMHKVRTLKKKLHTTIAVY